MSSEIDITEPEEIELIGKPKRKAPCIYVDKVTSECNRGGEAHAQLEVPGLSKPMCLVEMGKRWTCDKYKGEW